MRDATLSVVGGTTTYLWCLARSSMERWAPGAGLGTPDEDVTHSVDVAHLLDRRWEAIRAHASQASPYDDLPADLQREFLATDRLRLVRGGERRYWAC